MKQYLIFSILLTASLFGAAQIPAGYYDSADGLGGDALKTALYNIIKGHKIYEYTADTTDVWDILKVTDRDPQNSANVILVYTGVSVNAAQEWNDGNGWEREHVWAKSRGDFGTEMGAGTDVHHLRPINSDVNTMRNNRWFAESNEEYILNNVSTGCFYSSTEWTWEPRPEFKGDAARMIFYMATRYEGENGELDLEVVDYFPDAGTNAPLHALLSDLLAWHIEDPVSDFERNRNNIIYSQYQHNRNPFIDHPEWVQCIWDNNCSGLWFSSTPVTQLTDRESYTYTIVGNGAATSDLTISLEAAPAWLSLGSSTNSGGYVSVVLSGTPTTANLGAHSVSLKLTNGTESLYQDFEINVVDGNPIHFTSVPVTQASVGTEYTYSISVAGDAGATFNFTETQVPAWLTLAEIGNGTALLSGTPQAEHAGDNTITISVNDDAKKSIDQTFTVRVVNPNTSKLIISQYYEGVGSYDKFIELTNVGTVSIDLSVYQLGRWSTTGAPAGAYASGEALSGTLAAGVSRVYKNSGAVSPAYAASAGIPSAATYINGDDPVAITKNGNTWNDRVDCIYSTVISPKWGAETVFYRKSDVTSGNINPSIFIETGEWTEISEAAVLSAPSTATEYLGKHIYQPSSGVIEVSEQKIKIYPNPAAEVITIVCSEIPKLGNNGNVLTVYDIYGRTVLIQACTHEVAQQLNIAHLPVGLYSICLSGSGLNRIETAKFVKK